MLHGAKISATLLASSVTSCVTTSTNGFTSAMSSFSASVFFMPMWRTKYCWRFRLLGSTTSKSASTSLATPVRARLSAIFEPRPPSPATPTQPPASAAFSSGLFLEAIIAFSTSRPGIAPRLINTTFEPSFSSKFSFVAKPSRIKISGSLALNLARNL